MSRLDELLTEIRGCTHCAQHLPLGPRPVLRAKESARVLLIGQAPGTKVHETGIPWNDPSGDRLRQWLGLEREVFYDDSRFAIMPMGFCYPGRDKNGGDAPPRPECAPLWHEPVLEQLPNLELTLLIGSYAQARYLGSGRRKTMTETVRNWRAYQPDYLPLPHPSWRNTAWLRKNPWFEDEVIPVLRERVAELTQSRG
ncbi:MAG: uracil-DNA glycosylase family protein [Alphaproteobacteria bacterium]|nr:uracil-DNA glycosylase family protein [Alphaproteobacteria bacterium]